MVGFSLISHFISPCKFVGKYSTKMIIYNTLKKIENTKQHIILSDLKVRETYTTTTKTKAVQITGQH